MHNQNDEMENEAESLLHNIFMVPRDRKMRLLNKFWNQQGELEQAIQKYLNRGLKKGEKATIDVGSSLATELSELNKAVKQLSEASGNSMRNKLSKEFSDYEYELSLISRNVDVSIISRTQTLKYSLFRMYPNPKTE
jgi:hypothetical protein